jgi:rhodanese-related sulfurtransferase
MEQLTQFFSNHLGLWLTGFLILIFIFINEFIAFKKKAQELSPAQIVDLINNDNAVVIDLRDAETFKTGHIIDAVRVAPEDFNTPRMDKYKTKSIILVCAKGLQSAPLAVKLRQQGFTTPLVLSGGIAAWTTQGMPLVKGKTS